MTPRKKIALFASASLLALTVAAPQALAEDGSRHWYWSMFGGGAFAHPMESTFVIPGAGGPAIGTWTGKTELEHGFIVGSAIGASVSENLRTEIEFAFGRHGPKSTVETNAGGTPYSYAGTGGSLDSYTILANLWLDGDVSMRGITPYVGGGLGVAFVDSDMTWTGTTFDLLHDDSDVSFAFQAGVGLRYSNNSAITFDFGYRFRGIVEFDLAQNGVGPLPFVEKGLDLYTHVLLAGITFNFSHQ